MIRSVRAALNKQAIQVIKLIGDSGQVNDNFVDIIDDTEVRKSIGMIYRVVGIRFANQTHNAITNQKADFGPFFDEAMATFFAANVGDRITNITNHTKELLREILGRSFVEGLSIPDTVRLIRDRWLDITRFRAERIARTEIISASNFGSLTGAEATGLNLEKVWLATRDRAVRESHAFADGQKREMKSRFLVGSSFLEFPGDPKGAAEEVVNCRCTIIYDVL